MNNSKNQIIREPYLAKRVVFVDGLPGCGKTMMSPIISAFDRVELLAYSYEIEYICAIYYLGKMSFDAAVAMVRMLTDLKLYNTMMSRETNFRFSDLSSVFRDSKPLRYLSRLFQKGDESIPGKISKENPILNLTIHNLIAFSEPIFSALGERAVIIEVVRHPLYMIKQQALNFKYLVNDVRDFVIYYLYNNKQLPYYAFGWEDLFLKSNSVEKAIYFTKTLLEMQEKKKLELNCKYQAKIITIPFERFVVSPEPYVKLIEEVLGTQASWATKRMLKRQNIPRKMYSDGIALNIYKRCGWEPPKSNSEAEELRFRRAFAAKHASKEAMAVLDRLCQDYEKSYLLSEEEK